MSSVVLAAALLLAAQQIAAADPLRDFDAEVSAAMQELNVPGVAVGVIADGRILLARGYGVIEAGKLERVDADTIFPIASMTKSFTTAAMAILVDEGKLDWDAPVRDYVPWFRMYDPIATELITSRDLVTHRSGLPSHDFLRDSVYLERAELVRRIRYLPPNRTFRDTFQYNNLMYVVAGYVAGSVADSTWEELVQRRIFAPLGMRRSSVSIEAMQRMANHARPHQVKDGTPTVVDAYDYQRFGVGPNGAVNSTVNDLLAYLRMYLDEGRHSGQQLISPRQVRELFRPVITDGDNGAYALGWRVRARHGETTLDHSGSVAGFNSHMILLPRLEVGIVVLNNLYKSGLPRRLAWCLADRMLDIADRKIPAPPLSPDPPRQPLPRRVERTELSMRLADYAGLWFHPAYGNVEVTADGVSLLVRFDAAMLRLDHYHYDAFEIRDSGQLARFRSDATGQVAEMLLPLEQQAADFVFTRAAPSGGVAPR